MSTYTNLNAAYATSQKLECKANDIVQRDRFSSSTIQTTGNVYISNKFRPSSDLTDTNDWIKLTPLTTGLVVADYPFAWLGCDADYSVCSYCSGNS